MGEKFLEDSAEMMRLIIAFTALLIWCESSVGASVNIYVEPFGTDNRSLLIDQAGKKIVLNHLEYPAFFCSEIRTAICFHSETIAFHYSRQNDKKSWADNGIQYNQVGTTVIRFQGIERKVEKIESKQNNVKYHFFYSHGHGLVAISASVDGGEAAVFHSQDTCGFGAPNKCINGFRR